MTNSAPGLSFHHLALRASDYDKTVAMYQALGMRELYAWGEGDARICMLGIDGGGGIEVFAGAADRYPAEGRFQHFALSVRDIDATYAAALAAGFAPRQAPREDVLRTRPVGTPVRVAFVRGPDNESLEFLQTREA